MTLNIAPTKVYPVGDRTFSNRKEAVQYGKLLRRIDNLTAAGIDTKGYESDTVAEGATVVPVEDLPAIIARNGDKILEALQVRQFSRRSKDEGASS